MRYDLGTTAAAAAVARESGPVVMAALGDHGSIVPSLVLLREDGTWLVGDAAARRALVTFTRTDPEDLDPAHTQFAFDCAAETGN